MKHAFTIASLFAIVHLAALAGLAAYARTQGWLTRERVLRAVAVLRGEDGTGEDLTADVTEDAESPKSAGERIQRNLAIEEGTRIELDRRDREIQDGFRLLETQQLAFLRAKEAFDAEKGRFATEQKEQAKKVGDSGVKKELEILSGIKAKDAKELLRQKDDAEVVRILMSMELRQAKKIVAVCKTNEERLWIGRILGKLHEQSAIQAEALGAGS